MKVHHSIVAGAALLIAPAAFAQTTPAPAPTTPPTATPGPAAPAAGAAASATYTDAEVNQFAKAALAVEKVRQDATIPEADKNARMVAAISAVGIAPDRFNAIGQSMQSDPALNARIQKAAAAQLPASATPATPK